MADFDQLKGDLDFAPHPARVAFENQEKGEEIILLLRAHRITLMPTIIFILFLAIVPVVSGPVLSILGFDLAVVFSQVQLFLITIFWYLVTFGFAFFRLVFWYFNVYLITTARIIDFDFKGLLNKEISYTTYAHIEDVEPRTVGFFGTLVNYGHVFIQTAAERPEFVFENVEKPDIVAEKIMEQVQKAEKNRGAI